MEVIPQRIAAPGEASPLRLSRVVDRHSLDADGGDRGKPGVADRRVLLTAHYRSRCPKTRGPGEIQTGGCRWRLPRQAELGDREAVRFERLANPLASDPHADKVNP